MAIACSNLTNLTGSGAVGFLLDVHGKHLCAETQVLGLINKLLVRRDGLGAHYNVTLRNR